MRGHGEDFRTAAPSGFPRGCLHSSSGGPLPQESVSLHNIQDSILSQDTWDTEEDIILESIETLNHGGNGMHPPNVLHYALGQVCHREANGPGCVTSQLDHLLCTAHHLLVNLLPLLLLCISSGLRYFMETLAMFTPLHTGTLESPCSPRMHL